MSVIFVAFHVDEDDAGHHNPNAGWREGPDWRLISFSRRHADFEHPDKLDAQELVRKEAAGLAYRLDCYQHGGCTWSMHGEGTQCRFDTARGGGVLLWCGRPCRYRDERGRLRGLEALRVEREESARKFLKRFNAYINGEFYRVEVNDEQGETIESVAPFYEDELDHACTGYVLNRLGDKKIAQGPGSLVDLDTVASLKPHLADDWKTRKMPEPA